MSTDFMWPSLPRRMAAAVCPATRPLPILLTYAASRADTRSPILYADAGERQWPQAAAPVRPRRLLRCMVLVAALPALVRGQGLRGARAFTARPWRVRRSRDAVRHRPR